MRPLLDHPLFSVRSRLATLLAAHETIARSWLALRRLQDDDRRDLAYDAFERGLDLYGVGVSGGEADAIYALYVGAPAALRRRPLAFAAFARRFAEPAAWLDARNMTGDDGYAYFVDRAGALARAAGKRPAREQSVGAATQRKRSAGGGSGSVASGSDVQRDPLCRRED